MADLQAEVADKRMIGLPAGRQRKPAAATLVIGTDVQIQELHPQVRVEQPFLPVEFLAGINGKAILVAGRAAIGLSGEPRVLILPPKGVIVATIVGNPVDVVILGEIIAAVNRPHIGVAIKATGRLIEISRDVGVVERHPRDELVGETIVRANSDVAGLRVEAAIPHVVVQIAEVKPGLDEDRQRTVAEQVGVRPRRPTLGVSPEQIERFFPGGDLNPIEVERKGGAAPGPQGRQPGKRRVHAVGAELDGQVGLGRHLIRGQRGDRLFLLRNAQRLQLDATGQQRTPRRGAGFFQRGGEISCVGGQVGGVYQVSGKWLEAPRQQQTAAAAKAPAAQ